MDVQGWVVVGLALVLFGYLVPHLVHSRHQLAQARVDDRFSGSLRVVTTGATAKRPAPGEHHGLRESRPYLLGPRRRTEAPAVNRPTTPSERAATEARRLASARAARAAGISRRKAAARRRLVLTIVLLLATVGGWLGFGLASVSIALGVVPTVLLGAVLVAGRRAAKISARRNAADRAAMARLELQFTPRARPATAPTTTAAGSASAGTGSGGAGTGGAAEMGSGESVGREASANAGPDEAAETSSRDLDGQEKSSVTTTAAAPASARSGAPAVSGSAGARAAAVSGSAGAGAAAVSGSAKAFAESADVVHGEPGDVVGQEASTTAATDRPAATTGPHGAATSAAEWEAGGWTPVPVPVPSYTLKPSAPRRDIAPYEAPTPQPAVAAEEEAEPVVAPGLAGSPYGPIPDPEPVVAQAPEAPPSRGLDLDSVLARRRGA